MLKFVLFASLLSVAAAITALQTFCTGGTKTYYGSSCYVYRPVAPYPRYSVAKLACEDILGYYGHLYHLKNAAIQSATATLINANGGALALVWTSFEQFSSAGARTANWGLGNTDGTVTNVSFVPWYPGEPNAINYYNRASYLSNSNGLRAQYESNATGSSVGYFMCEYEEANQHPVSKLEKGCANVSLYHVYVNNKCYVMHPQVLNYYTAKKSCNDIAGFSGHLAQPRSNSDLNIIDNLMLTPTGIAGNIHIGIEKIATDTVGGSKWYYATTTGTSYAATFLPWATAAPSNGTNVYYQNRTYFDTVSSVLRPFICVYGTYGPVYESCEKRQYQRDGLLYTQMNQSTNISFAKCLRQCRLTFDCTSMAYSYSSMTCQLITIAASSSAANFTLLAGFDIFRITQ